MGFWWVLLLLQSLHHADAHAPVFMVEIVIADINVTRLQDADMSELAIVVNGQKLHLVVIIAVTMATALPSQPLDVETCNILSFVFRFGEHLTGRQIAESYVCQSGF